MFDQNELQKMEEFCSGNDISSKELAILLHTTGCRYWMTEDRNHYYANPVKLKKSVAAKSMFKKGLLEIFKPKYPSPRYVYLRATPKGLDIANYALQMKVQSNNGASLEADPEAVQTGPLRDN